MILPSFVVLHNEKMIKPNAAPIYSAPNFQDCMVGFMNQLYSGEYNNYTHTYFYGNFPVGNGKSEWRIYSPFDIENGLTIENIMDSMPELFNVLSEPMSIKEIKERANDNYVEVEGVVPVKLDDIVENDYDGFLDIICEGLIGSHMLRNINYSIVGHQDEETILIKVSGDASEFLEEMEEEEE